VVPLAAGSVIVITGLRILGRLPASGGLEVSEALWLRRGRLALRASIARGVLSIVAVGLGASLGREAAPQLVGAATASKLAGWTQLPVWQRRLLVASGAGAAFGAVYNVPLGGTLFALEVLLGTLALRLVLPALVTSVTATAVAWIWLGTGATYHVPSLQIEGSQLVWAVLLGPIVGLVAVGWMQIISRATRARPTRHGRYLAPPIAFLAGSYALIGGGAFLAAAMQAPLAGAVLALELTRNFNVMVPTLVAVAEATVVARRLGAHSIYSARPKTRIVRLRDVSPAARSGHSLRAPARLIVVQSRSRAETRRSRPGRPPTSLSGALSRCRWRAPGPSPGARRRLGRSSRAGRAHVARCSPRWQGRPT
jgi:H+/Cl- antiporter ClcA